MLSGVQPAPGKRDFALLQYIKICGAQLKQGLEDIYNINPNQNIIKNCFRNHEATWKSLWNCKEPRTFQTPWRENTVGGAILPHFKVCYEWAVCYQGDVALPVPRIDIRVHEEQGESWNKPTPGWPIDLRHRRQVNSTKKGWYSQPTVPGQSGIRMQTTHTRRWVTASEGAAPSKAWILLCVNGDLLWS